MAGKRPAGWIWDLLPTRPGWAGGFRDEWMAGEAGAMDRLDDFGGKAAAYDVDRNLPSKKVVRVCRRICI